MLISLLASSCTIWMKWSACYWSVVSLALPACTLSLILCKVGVPKTERGDEKTDICLTKLWELSPFILPVTRAASLCSLHLFESWVFWVWGGWKREESPGTTTLLCTSLSVCLILAFCFFFNLALLLYTVDVRLAQAGIVVSRWTVACVWERGRQRKRETSVGADSIGQKIKGLVLACPSLLHTTLSPIIH